jgi:ABC-type antimicrobial peptide transport system permease subunit
LQIVTVGVLAGLGLLLASLGLYSLMAYQVATRRQELGIRKALGAPHHRLMADLVAGGLAMALLGAAIGMGAWYELLPRAAALWMGSTQAATWCRSPSC